MFSPLEYVVIFLDWAEDASDKNPIIDRLIKLYISIMARIYSSIHLYSNYLALGIKIILVKISTNNGHRDT